MTRNNRIFLALVTVIGALGANSGSVLADRAGATSRTTTVVDVEVDPIAYALDGYSLHAGLRWGRLRLDLGAFALEMPESLHGVEGVDVYGSGFGAKLDYHPIRRLAGFFVGAQITRGREIVTHRMTGQSSQATLISLGARAGYRIDVTGGFYVLPWLGVDVSLGDRLQTVSGVDYDPGRLLIFPTVHVGKRF